MSIHEHLDRLFDEQMESTKKLLRFESTEDLTDPATPFGQEVNQCLVSFLELGERLGFSTKNVDGYAGHISFGEGPEILGILAHIDVVPAGEGWTVPPYEGVIKDGLLYGRGVIDDKGPAVAALYAMKALKDSGFVPKKEIRLILGTNEETGWQGIQYYLEKEKTPDMAFTPDADFPVIYAEMGILVFDLVYPLEKGPLTTRELSGGNRPNMVPDRAHARLAPLAPLVSTPASVTQEPSGESVTFSAFGKSAHGSTPEKGDNAIAHLLATLATLDLGGDPLEGFLSDYQRLVGFDLNGERMGCAFSDDDSGPLVFNVGTLTSSETEVRLGINIRYPISSSGEEVLVGMKKALEGTPFQVENFFEQGPIAFSKEDPLIQVLLDSYEAITGERPEPLAIGGGTYARALTGAVAFGPLLPGREELAHQPDEHMALEDLRLVTAIYAEAISRLTGGH